MKKLILAGLVAAFVAAPAFAGQWHWKGSNHCNAHLKNPNKPYHWKDRCDEWPPNHKPICEVEVKRDYGTLWIDGKDKWSKVKTPAYIVVKNNTNRNLTLKVSMNNPNVPINARVVSEGFIGWVEQYSQPMNIFPGHGQTGYRVYPGNTNLYFQVKMDTQRNGSPLPGHYSQTLTYSCEEIY